MRATGLEERSMPAAACCTPDIAVRSRHDEAGALPTGRLVATKAHAAARGRHFSAGCSRSLAGPRRGLKGAMVELPLFDDDHVRPVSVSSRIA